MNNHFARAGSCIRHFLTIFLLPLLLHTVSADVTVALVQPDPGNPSPRLNLTLLNEPPRTAVPIQHKGRLTDNDWLPFDTILTDSSGNGSTSFYFDSKTADGKQHFFRAVTPVPQINLVQPGVVTTTGGQVFLVGQLFNPSFTVKIDGVTVSSNFTDANTFVVNTGALGTGFHTITLLDGTNNILVTLTNGLFVTNTGRTDQESPPLAPMVNQSLTFDGGHSTEDPDGGCSDAIGKCAWDFNRAGTESEINADSHSRVKVHFFWDREGKKDSDSSCWIRVQPPEAAFFDSYYNPNLAGSKLQPLFAVPRVNEATGELIIESLDLVLPGRGGLDLIWGRTYRSKIGMDTAMGVGWDFSYNIRAAQNGSSITVQDGQNRTDTYFLQSDGSFSNDELFRRGTLAGNVFTLQHANNTSWVFKPLDGSPASGKIDRIIDRNSNQLQFQYDGSGRLFLIFDTLGRPLQIGYDAAGRIQFVQDFSGRQLVYQHHPGGALGGGSLGDLLSVRSPVINGTPNGNDFSGGKTAQFTYSFNFADAARNHNLLTARDGNNVQWFQAAYTPTSLTSDLLYDRLASVSVGTDGETHLFTYLAQTPSLANRFATTKTIVNDAAGNVHELIFDAKNRLMDRRQFTGHSTAGLPVTESTNRPTGQLRPTDPAFFRTTIDWNRDSLATRVTWPKGNGVEMVYERDFDSSTNPRFRANLRVHRQSPVSGTPLVQRFEHASGFGTGERQKLWTCANFRLEPENPKLARIRMEEDEASYYVRSMDTGKTWQRPGTAGREPVPGPHVTRLDWSAPGDEGPEESITFVYGTLRTDARGNTWTYTRDANGNLTHAQSPIAATATDYEYNANGQLTAVVKPANASAHRERDELHYYSSGAQNGYLQTYVRDMGGLDLTTSYQYDAVGNLVQVTDPRGTPTQFAVNQLNQVVQVSYNSAAPGQTPVPYLRSYTYDANNRLTAIDVQNKDEFGNIGANTAFTTTFTYDALDHRTAMTQEVDSSHTVTTQYFYDALRNLTEVRSPLAVSAVQPDARVQYSYDERNLPFTATGAPGSANSTRATYTYDPNGNRTNLETGAPGGSQHTTTYVYDGFDRLTQRTDPVGTQFQYSYNNNHDLLTTAMQGHLLDSNGNPLFGPLGSVSYTYDFREVMVSSIASWFDPFTGGTLGDGARTTTYTYDPALNLTARTDDNGHASLYSYDGANRLSRVTDPKANRVDYTYDADGNLGTRTRTDKSDLGAGDQAFTTIYAYDGLNRVTSATDNVGNMAGYSYDSRGNLVRAIDPKNNLTQYEYDGLNRLTRSGRDLDGNSSGFNAADIITGRLWDDNSRLIGMVDPNNHGTQYVYDPLDRLTRQNNADTTFKMWSYDAWGNPIQSKDENGTACLYTYDNLNRLTQRQITPGAGVSNATTFEIYDYPGNYLLPLRAINDVAATRFTYDSLGRLTSERLANRVTSYTYDGEGNLLTLQSPGGRTTAYTYDSANHCSGLSLTVTSDGDSLGPVTVYEYVGDRMESVGHRNGTSTSYTYDGFLGAPLSSDRGWGQVITSLTSGPGTILDQRTFTYDANQNLSERRDTRPGGTQRLFHYDYDRADRNNHTQVTAGAPIVRETIYSYDLNGNRVSVNGLGTPNPGSYLQDNGTPTPADAQMNQYTTTPLGNYNYDANGNRIGLNGGGGNTSYRYDYANRLIDLTNANTGVRIANYQYDPLGRRIQKTLDPDGTPSVTNFIYTGRTVLEERDGAGAINAAYSCTLIVDGIATKPVQVAFQRLAPGGGESCDDDCSSQREYCVQYRESDFDFASRLMEEEGIYYFRSRNSGHASERSRMQFFFSEPIAMRRVDKDDALWYLHSRSMANGRMRFFFSEPIEMRRGGVNYTYHAEVVPWLWLMTNGSGAPAERYDYEDFGDPHVFNGAGASLATSAIGNPYLFRGMRFDGESALYTWSFGTGPRQTIDLSAVYFYDPKIGASLQREPSHAVNAWGTENTSPSMFIQNSHTAAFDVSVFGYEPERLKGAPQ